MRHLRFFLALLVVAGLASAVGCKAMENDPILGNKPFQPNMSTTQGG